MDNTSISEIAAPILRSSLDTGPVETVFTSKVFAYDDADDVRLAVVKFESGKIVDGEVETFDDFNVYRLFGKTIGGEFVESRTDFIQGGFKSLDAATAFAAEVIRDFCGAAAGNRESVEEYEAETLAAEMASEICAADRQNQISVKP